MKRKILKQIAALVTAAAVTLTYLPTGVFAISGDNSGAGSWGGVSGGYSTWNDDHQGYRICIVNSHGTPVSNAVDILYREAPSASETITYHTTRTGGTSSLKLYWTDIGFSSNSIYSNDPPTALEWKYYADGTQGPEGNGDAVNTWFNTEGNAPRILNATYNGSYIFTFSSAEDKNLISGGKTVADVIQSNGYYLTVEPITWFKPLSSDQSTEYSKYIYGTIYNICKWYNDNSDDVVAHVGANGGFYVNVIHCLWTSMFIKSNVLGLTGSPYKTTFTQYDGSEIVTLYNAMETLGAGLHVYYFGDDSKGDIILTLWVTEDESTVTGSPVDTTTYETNEKAEEAFESITSSDYGTRVKIVESKLCDCVK